MKREHLGRVVGYRFQGLDDSDGLIHAVLTRIGGVSRAPYATLNLSDAVGDDPVAVRENHQRALGPLGWDRGQVVSPWQVHGAGVAVVEWEHRGAVPPQSDAVVTAVPGVPLMMRFGDCTPILLFDPWRRAVGLAHAGWRGVVAGVAAATIETMTQRLGSTPAEIWAGIGPTIGPCCYEVGTDVARDIASACPPSAGVLQVVDGHVHADLPAAVESQLRAAGVQRVEQAAVCTACRVDEFFSHRAEAGRTGRFGVVIGLERG